jgi:murein DD-endopeptidase MepM/ murein hydrolase activator NlpD
VIRSSGSLSSGYGWREKLRLIAATATLTSLVWILVGAMLLTREVEPSSGPQLQVPLPSASHQAMSPNAPVQLPGRLMIPVEGVSRDQLSDTWGQSRSGGARQHQAIDIMAPKGTPVLAAAPGTVEKLFVSERGGITAYVRSEDLRLIYYYAHLERYAPGLSEQQNVRAGQLIGYVGETGNVAPGGPHLHFAVNVVRPEEKWYQGTPLNPYPLLRR